MDEIPVLKENNLRKLLNRKVILTVLGLIVLLEVVWAVWSLNPKTAPTTGPISTVSPTPPPTVISLKTPDINPKVGEKVKVAINISSDVNSDGTDLVMVFDPKLLTVQTTGNVPVQPGTIYSTYPQNKLEKGRITISGITDQVGGVVANGVFGTVIFQAKAAGLTKISLEFSPGSTIDSNVIKSGSSKDVLDKVENLEVTILP